MTHGIVRLTLAIWLLAHAAVCSSCSERRENSQPTLQNQWGDPIARTFEHCGDLFTQTTNNRSCVFSDRRERGYDVVEEEITCAHVGSDVECKLRPGAGPGPDLNWMNYACDRVSRVCRITAGELGFTAAYSPLFAGHNAGLKSDRNVPQAESR